MDDVHHCRVHLLRAWVAFASRRAPTSAESRPRTRATDPTLARATYLEALSAAMFSGRLARSGGVSEISEAALASPPVLQPPGPSDFLLQGLAVRFTEGYAAGPPILKEGLACVKRRRATAARRASLAVVRQLDRAAPLGHETWTALSTRRLELVREAGALTALRFVLINRSSVYVFFGDLGEAAAYEEELQAATEATEIAAVPYGALALAALRGQEAELTGLARTTVGDAQVRGEGLALTITEFLGGTLNLGPRPL